MRRDVDMPSRERHPEIDAVTFCEQPAALDQVILIFFEDKRITFAPENDTSSGPRFAFRAEQEIIGYLNRARPNHLDFAGSQRFVAGGPAAYFRGGVKGAVSPGERC